MKHSLYLLIVLSIWCTGAYVGSLLPQRPAWADDPHVLITAQRSQSAVDAALAVLRGGYAQFALLDLLVKITGVVI